MNNKIIITLLIVVLAQVNALHGKTTITDNTGGKITPTGINDSIKQFQDIVDDFGPAFANAYLMGNLAGYPIGTSILGGFPHFLIGVSLNSGFSNLERFDPDVQNSDKIFPAAGLAPSAFFGLGITKTTDVLFKFLLFSDGFYMPPLSMSLAELTKLNLYSVGGKVRHSLIEPVTILPGMFKFGGITIAGGLDYMYGIIEIQGKNLVVPLMEIEIDPTPSSGDEAIVGIDLESDYTFQNKWYMVSASTSALAYFDFFWIFGVYTGVGFAVSYGAFNLDFNSTSEAVADSPHGSLGTITVDSKNRYAPYYYSPLYILGMELNLFLIRLTFETMVNLRNGSDINLQLGARIQF